MYTKMKFNIIIDPCNSDPCVNGGTCTYTSNSYNCSCVSGYRGDHCETGLNICHIIRIIIIMFIMMFSQSMNFYYLL